MRGLQKICREMGSSWGGLPPAIAGSSPMWDGGVPEGPGEDLAIQQVGLGTILTTAPDLAYSRAMAAFVTARDEWNWLAEAGSGIAAEAYRDNLPARYEAMLAIYRLARDFHHACGLDGCADEAPHRWASLDPDPQP